MMRIRTIRHWKQRFNPNAAFICRRRMEWGDGVYEPGDPIPEGLAENRGKLRRFWEAGRIELAEFEALDVVTGQDESEPVIAEPEPDTDDADEAAGAGTDPPSGEPDGQGGEAVWTRRGGYYDVVFPDGSTVRVRGKAALDGLLAERGAGPA